MAIIRRSYEDGTLTLATWKTRSSDDAYSYPSNEEILNCIKYAPYWDSIDESVYRAFCDNLGLDYDSFDDPDAMFDALEEAVADTGEKECYSEKLVQVLQIRMKGHQGNVFAFKAFEKQELMQALKEAGYAQTEENFRAVLDQTGLVKELSTVQAGEQNAISRAIGQASGLTPQKTYKESAPDV